jgi:plastocyanin
MRASLLLTLPLVVGLTACGGSSDGGDGASGGGGDVAVKAGDTTCEVATTTFDPGKITFDVQNTGKDVTEVYVYGKGSDGEFDKVVGEVENIAPGTSRDFAVSVSGGEYEVACKPGQKGDGIRTEIEVSGAAASEDDAKYDREVEVTAKEYAFTGLEGFTAKVGEKIEFKLENAGTMEHELEILGPDGKDVGEVGPTGAGKDGEVIIAFEKPGTYTYKCGIADHASRGMQATFPVS